MALDPTDLPASAAEFLRERHLATLTTLRADGRPHVVAVGFTWDAAARVARVITSDGSQKVRNVERHGVATVAQVDGGRWLALSGPARVARDPVAVADAVGRYRDRYREPRENARRVVIEIAVTEILGRA